ncbi:MAG: phosphomannomutase [Actinomycetota bacterium]|nr:phosphomannomutase [Actinomycetota bacterium]
MATLLAQLLEVVEVCVISGGQFGQFESQLIAGLPGSATPLFGRLHLLPTCGTQYYRYEDGWKQQYAENLTAAQKERTLAVLEASAKELGLWESTTWGPILEDRGSQITFSALGQEAPVDAKRAWDPTGAKKESLRAAVAPQLPELEVRSGGSTSIDVTRKGIDKAYGMRRLAELTSIPIDRMVFVGDRLDAGGNDYPVKSTGVRTYAVTDWRDTARFVEAFLGR